MSNGFAWISPSNSPTLLFYNLHDWPDLGNEWRKYKILGRMCFNVLFSIANIKIPNAKSYFLASNMT